MKTYYVYILICSDNSYYTGITNNLERREAEHNEGNSGVAYTYSRRPVRLAWWTEFSNPDMAIELEKQIKGWSRRKKEALISGDWDKLKRLSKNYKQFGKL